MACQVEVAVVCHVDNGILIAASLIVDFYGVLIGQGIRNGHFKVSRESLVSVRAHQNEGNGAVIRLFYVPEAVIVSVRAAVQVVVVLIFCQLVCFSVQFKCWSRDTVSVSSDGGSKMASVGLIAGYGVKSKDNVSLLSILIRNENRYQMCAVIGYADFHSVFIGERVEQCFFSVFCCSKTLFFHVPSPFGCM